MNLGNLKTAVTQTLGKGKLFVKKHSPEMLIGMGVVCVVAGTVEACKATLKCEEVLDEHKEMMEKVNRAKEDLEAGVFPESLYSEKDYKRDVVIVYTKTCINMVKLYSLPIGLTVTGIACFLGAHKIMSGRVAAISAAYNIVDSKFKEYRKNVVEEFGEEIDKKLYFKKDTEEIEKRAERKDIMTTQNTDHARLENYSQYSKIFDEFNPNWNNDPELNLIFLRAQQNYMNDLLIRRGHLFLNEVYDALGFPRTKAGSVVGWILDGRGDNYVDFNIYDPYNYMARQFVNGYEPSIILDFNVDGLIYDKI